MVWVLQKSRTPREKQQSCVRDRYNTREEAVHLQIGVTSDEGRGEKTYFEHAKTPSTTCTSVPQYCSWGLRRSMLCN